MTTPEIKHKWVGGELEVGVEGEWFRWSAHESLREWGGVDGVPYVDVFLTCGYSVVQLEGIAASALLDHVARLYEERAEAQESRWWDYIGQTDPRNHPTLTVLGSIAAALMPFHTVEEPKP